MMDQLPEGKSIGWMQAPPQWIFSHTLRFIGIVRIVIQDGEGFILINKGKVLGYYFKHGRIDSGVMPHWTISTPTRRWSSTSANTPPRRWRKPYGSAISNLNPR